MKKFVAATLALSLVAASVSVTMPKRADAALGIGSFVFGGVPLIVVGGVLTGGAVAVSGFGSWALAYAAGDSSSFNASFERAVGVLAMIAGVVLLDGEGGRDLAFSAVSPAEAQQLGLTPDETRSFNAELPEVNAVRESVQGEVVAEVQSGKHAAEVDVHAKWERYREMLEPATFSALEKVSAHMIAGLKSARN